ncbi:hypothetical protein H0A71_02160 [Alcaligenaceae bacterium]|nr:hypothetical protein [Alcaligenaceae bacterium]
MTNPAYAEAPPRHTKPLIQKATEAFMALAFNMHAVRETIAAVNEQIKKEVGDDIWQAVQNQLA